MSDARAPLVEGGLHLGRLFGLTALAGEHLRYLNEHAAVTARFVLIEWPAPTAERPTVNFLNERAAKLGVALDTLY